MRTPSQISCNDCKEVIADSDASVTVSVLFNTRAAPVTDDAGHITRDGADFSGELHFHAACEKNAKFLATCASYGVKPPGE